MKQPKNISVKRIYEPNMQAMVKALRLVLETGKKETTKKAQREELAG